MRGDVLCVRGDGLLVSKMDSRYLRGTLGTCLIESGHLGINSIQLEIDYIYLEMDSRDQDIVVRNL